MPLNPVHRDDTLNNPIQRGNPLNDPKHQEQQGYNNYELNNTQLLTPRFGEVTPSTVFETVPGDRHMLHGNSISILNQIDSNLFSEVNCYHDYFYVPMRSIFPINYEKIVPNPTKGSDLPIDALPQIPLLQFFRNCFYNDNAGTITYFGDDEEYVSEDYEFSSLTDSVAGRLVLLNNLIYVATVLSRGQLLDYLGYSLDSEDEYANVENPYRRYLNTLQSKIDDFFNSLVAPLLSTGVGVIVSGYDVDDDLILEDEKRKVYYNPGFDSDGNSLSSVTGVRSAISDCLEAGLFIDIRYNESDDTYARKYFWSLESDSFSAFRSYFLSFLSGFDELVDASYADFPAGYINPMRIVAYQQAVAEYMSNDTIDNVYTAELWMQNIRSIMFPAFDSEIISGTEVSYSKEPTFVYNGVQTEYDYFTTGAFRGAFFGDTSYLEAKLIHFISNVFILRRSLRYGDYFATGRPRLLAVGQLGIPVSQGQINPIDVTKNLVLQRFLNAVNWVGSKFLNYMTSIFGVKPSETGCHPVFIAHRKVPMSRNITTNTSQDQGKQTTNLLGMSDNNAFDIFIDDFGVVVGVVSFDALPVYPSGIDANFRNSDRYSMFNSMLQNVGDQAIYVSELTGIPNYLGDSDKIFAYTVRYAQYKFGISRAHGAFVNSLPGYSMLYPARSFYKSNGDIVISPDVIRDKPFYFDQFFASRTGISPAQYYHFIVSVTNQHSAARKMQYQPPVL